MKRRGERGEVVDGDEEVEVEVGRTGLVLKASSRG